MNFQSDLSILAKMESCSLAAVSVERRRLQTAAGIVNDTISPSSLSEKLQTAFFAGKVFTMIEDNNIKRAKITTSPQELTAEKAAAKRTLQDLYSETDPLEQQRIASLTTTSEKSCLEDRVFTFEGHQMLHRDKKEEMSSTLSLIVSRKMSALTPPGKHVSCAHLY